MKDFLYQMVIIMSIAFLTKQETSEFWDGIENELSTQNALEDEIKEAENGNLKNIVDPHKVLKDELIQIGGNDAQHMRNFKKIATDIQEYENSYSECINNISENDFTEKKINECVGTDFQNLLDDLDFLEKKIISKIEQRIRHLFIEECYKPAGLDEVFSNACDLLEKDCLNLLWEEFNFYKLLLDNGNKYLYEHAKLNKDIFENLMKFLEPIHSEWWELSTEAYNHKDLTIVRLKSLIDQRTKIIVSLASENVNAPQAQIFKHNIEIEERIINPNLVNVNNLPRPTILNSSEQMYQEGSNPLVDEFKDEYGEEALNIAHNFNTEGPTIIIPTKKAKIKKY